VTSRCTMMLEQISAYLDGELPASTCVLIERHCNTCDACRTLVAGLRQTLGVCREAGRRPVPPSVRELAKRRVAQLLTASSRRAVRPSSSAAAPAKTHAAAPAKRVAAARTVSASDVKRRRAKPKATPRRSR
jgi:anti-sigma factor RsiW